MPSAINRFPFLSKRIALGSLNNACFEGPSLWKTTRLLSGILFLKSGYTLLNSFFFRQLRHTHKKRQNPLPERVSTSSDRMGPPIFSQNYIFQHLKKVQFHTLTYSLTFILNCKSHIKVGQIIVKTDIVSNCFRRDPNHGPIFWKKDSNRGPMLGKGLEASEQIISAEIRQRIYLHLGYFTPIFGYIYPYGKFSKI